jgi:hypothetical protein
MPKKELAILYRRFIVSAKEHLIPFAKKQKTLSEDCVKLISLVNQETSHAEKTYS